MTIFSEARAALRPWLRRPLVAASAVISLAAGLAAATSVFAVTDAILWQPLPLPDAHRVVWISSVDRGAPDATSPGVFSAWSARAQSLSVVGGLRPAHGLFRPLAPAGATEASAVERLAGAYASAGAFEALGVAALLGRTVRAGDADVGAAPVLVISHRLWQAQFSSAGDVIGRAVDLNGQPRVIVGVMPAALDAIPFGFDWWAPLSQSAAQAANVGPRYLAIIGRLGAAPASVVEQELATLSSASGARGDTGLPLGVRVEPLQRHLTGDARPFLLPLFAAVLGVVLLAAVNAANLLLAHGNARRAEIGIRASLGASRGRLVRQLLLESAWLTAAAAALALLQALWMIDLLKQLLPAELSTLAAAHLDLRAVVFVGVLASAVTAVCGLLPAVRNSSFVLTDAVTSGRTTGAGHHLRRAFVIVQVALALTIGTAAALMARTTLALAAAPRGYDDEQVLTAALQFSPAAYPDAPRLRAAVARVVDATANLPGVSAAAVATRVPLSGGTPGSDLVLTSETFAPGGERQVRVRFVTPGYFAAVGTPVIAGRDVAPSDDERGPLVVMVNDALARRLNAPGSIVGRAVKFAVRDFNIRGAETPWQVIGVVADARDRGPRAPVQPEVYLPMAQGPADVFEWIGRQAMLTIRAEDAARLDVAAVRRAVAGAEPALALFDVLTLGDRLRRHLSPERVMAAMLVPLGVTAMGLSAFGLFTLLMQFVANRRRELAIRMSLGASPQRVVWSLVREGLTLAASGIVFGLVGATIAGRALSALMFGVAPSDPATLAGVVALTILTTLAAVWLPARHAAGVDPAAVLRGE